MLTSGEINNYKQYLKSGFDYMCEHGYSVRPCPEIILDDSDQGNDIFMPTAYYDPSRKCIVLKTHDRAYKDVVRSFFHECIHWKQQQDGTLDRSGYKGDRIVDDEKLLELEKEAYLKGNIAFRSWTEEESKKSPFVKDMVSEQLILPFGKIPPIIGEKYDDFSEMEREPIRIVEERGVAASIYSEVINGINNFIEQNAKQNYGNVRVLSFSKDKMPEFWGWANSIDFIIHFETRNGGAYLPYKSKIINGIYDPLVIELYVNSMNYNKQMISSIIFHEMNHAYEDLQLKKKDVTLNQTVELSNIDSDTVCQGMQHNEPFAYVLYILFIPTEMRAIVAELYGELKAAGIDRKEFDTFLEDTNAYNRYLSVKFLLKQLQTRQDIPWNKLIDKYFKDASKVSKEIILQVAAIKLNTLFRKMCKAASLYFDNSRKTNENT